MLLELCAVDAPTPVPGPDDPVSRRQTDRPRSRLVCVVDASLSMRESYGPDERLSKIDRVKIFAQLLVKTMSSDDWLGIVTFGTDARVVLPLQKLTEEVKVRTILEESVSYAHPCVRIIYVILHLLDALILGRQTIRVSSTTPGRRCNTIIFSKFTPLLPCLRTIELPFVVIAYNCSQFHASFLRFFEVTQTAAIRYYNSQCYVAISRVGVQETIKIFTGCIKYQGIDGYLFDNVVYPVIL